VAGSAHRGHKAIEQRPGAQNVADGCHRYIPVGTDGGIAISGVSRSLGTTLARENHLMQIRGLRATLEAQP
jgi:hypothetical protein